MEVLPSHFGRFTAARYKRGESRQIYGWHIFARLLSAGNYCVVCFTLVVCYENKMAARSYVRLLNVVLQRRKIFRWSTGRFSYGIRTQIASDVRQRHPRRYSSDGAAESNPAVCWKCGKQNEAEIGFLCRHCGVIREINLDINYFRLFGLDAEYALNSAALTSKFRYLQSQVHPDKFADKTKRERDYSLSYSSLLNEAYRTLLDPVDRGFYMLSLEHQGNDESELIVDAEFLAEIMEQNERLADGEHLSTHTLEEIRTEIRHVIDELLTVLALAFRSRDLQTSKRTLAKLKYYTNIISKIKSLEMERGITH